MSIMGDKKFEVLIPKGLKAGDSFTLKAGEETKTIVVPPGCKAGSKVSVVIGGAQAGITQAYAGQRTTRQDGKTKLEQLNAIKIVSGIFICQAGQKSRIFV